MNYLMENISSQSWTPLPDFTNFKAQIIFMIFKKKTSNSSFLMEIDY